MNNTLNHVSDSAVFVKFDSNGTDWPESVTDVQTALADIGSWATKSVGLPTASVGIRGIAAVASEEEVTEGIDNTKFITPATLAFRLQSPKASQTVWGYTRYATDDEAQNVEEDTVSLTPRSVDVVFNTRQATETRFGSAKLSTTLQAKAGTDDSTSMTPLKVKQAISALVPVQSNATEDTFGLVQLATVAELRSGTIREGFAISPYTFIRATATSTNVGVVMLASNGEVATGTDVNKAITPASLASLKGSASQYGLLRTSSTIGNLANTALAANAAVLASDRNSVTSGAVYQSSATAANKYQTFNEVEANIPVGGMFMAAYNSDYGNTMICNGRGLNKNTYNALFGRIGYTYGGGGDIFNIPDMRGVAARGYDNGRGLDPGRRFGTYQADEFRSHEHKLQMLYQSNGNIPSWAAVYELKGAEKNDQQLMTLNSQYSKALAAGGNETRMKNLAVNYVIRVR
ncbi:baseplate protein [Pantoea phage Phynn]|nr:baseplate protein [Pantoea phage Phynn]